MMVVFRHAHLTNRTVLRSCRLGQLTGFTFVVLLVDLTIVVGLVFLNTSLVVLPGDFPGLSGAGLVVDPEADQGEDVGHDDLVVRD